MLGDEDRSIDVALDVIPIAEELGEWVSLHRVLITLANIYSLRGQFVQAVDALKGSLEAAERLGSPQRVAFVSMEIGALRFLQGNWSEAATHT